MEIGTEVVVSTDTQKPTHQWYATITKITPYTVEVLYESDSTPSREEEPITVFSKDVCGIYRPRGYGPITRQRYFLTNPRILKPVVATSNWTTSFK